MRHALVVNDTPEILRAVSAVLTAEGYCVTSADCLRAAKGVIHTEWPDLVITDMELADGSGLELVPLARRSNSHALIWMFTACCSEGLIAKAKDCGADLVLDRFSLTLAELQGFIRDTAEGKSSKPARLPLEDAEIMLRKPYAGISTAFCNRDATAEGAQEVSLRAKQLSTEHQQTYRRRTMFQRRCSRWARILW
jgi:DNA-binding response OmpR family regulator